MSSVSEYLLPAVQNPLLYLSINSPTCYSKTNNSNFPWNLSQNNLRPSMSTTPRPNQHQMSPEPFLFSPLTSLFFVSLALSCLEFHIPCAWGHTKMVVVWAPCRTLLLMIYSVGQVLICWILSGLKNEHHCILNTVMHSFPWNWAKPGKRCNGKIASLQAPLSASLWAFL